MNKDSFFVVQRWMLDYGLKGNDLMVYAIIYGYSQNGDGCFHGGLDNLCEWTNSTKQGLMKNLAKLEEMKLVTKKEIYVGSCKYCEYKAVRPLNKVKNEENTVKQSLIAPLNKVTQPLNKVTNTVKQSLPNNILDNISNNINNNICNDSQSSSFIENFDFVYNKEYVRELFEKWQSLKLKDLKSLTNFLQYEYKKSVEGLKGYHSNTVLKAIENYAKVKAIPEADTWFTANYSFDVFVRKLDDFISERFDYSHYFKDEAKKKMTFNQNGEEKEEGEDLRPDMYRTCGKCGVKNLYWNNITQVFKCHTCQSIFTYEECENYRR